MIVTKLLTGTKKRNYIKKIMIDFLYVKKQVLEGLEDFKQGRSYSIEEMENKSRTWKLESQKRQNDS